MRGVNVKVKAQIEKPLRKEIVGLTQQDSVLLTILGCGMVDLVAPTTMTLVPATQQYSVRDQGQLLLPLDAARPGDWSLRYQATGQSAWGTPTGSGIQESGYGPTERLRPTSSLSARLHRPAHNRKLSKECYLAEFIQQSLLRGGFSI